MESLLAVVFTDLVDSTAVNARMGDRQMVPLWDAHDGLSRVLLQTWGGREIERSDGFVAVFETATAAARFLVDYQRMLVSLPVPIKARSALHIGTLVQRHAAASANSLEVFGLAKALCARLMAIAGPGQILCSKPAVDALTVVGLSIRSHGHWRLKGIDEPTEVCELSERDSIHPPPMDGDKAFRVVQVDGKWISVRDVPHRLPREIDRFFGRGLDLAALSRHADLGSALVTLTGPGGMGKTRLALRYAWGWLGAHAGGVYFCDLSPARDERDIASAVARALQIPLGAQPVDQLADAIRSLGTCLLILDNFEQVLTHAPATVQKWMLGAPQARFIVTSRERLGLPGEQVLQLEPLDEPAAVTLFHDRASSALGSYREDQHGDVMAQLVGTLDHLPLAIELAAARVPVAAPESQLALMADRFQLLSSRAGRIDRHATLQATLEWSWELLSDVERSVLAQLTVFHGSFSLSAAQAVVRLPHVNASSWMLDVLQSLLDKSLLRKAEHERFQFLTCVHEYANLKLRTPGAFDGSGTAFANETAGRHRLYFAGIDEAQAVADGCVDSDNLKAACRSACLAGDGNAATSAARLAWCALRLTGPFTAAIELVRLVNTVPGLTPEARATLAAVRGAALYAAGDTEEAGAAVKQGLAIVPDTAPPVLPARLHCTLGEVLSVQGRGAEAAGHLCTALHFAQGKNTPAVLCQVLNAQGALAQDEGRLVDAVRHYDRALAVAKLHHDRRWQAAVLCNLAMIEMTAGRFDEALALNQRALQHAKAAGDLRWLGNAYCNLGLIHHEKGESDEAEINLREALSVARRLGHKALEYMTLCNLGLVQEKQGRLSEACDQHQAAVDGAARLGDVRVEAQLRSCLGSALARLGRHDEARLCLLRARELVAPLNDLTTLGLVLCSAAENEALAAATHDAAAALAGAAESVRASGADAQSELGRRYEQVRSLILG